MRSRDELNVTLEDLHKFNGSCIKDVISLDKLEKQISTDEIILSDKELFLLFYQVISLNFDELLLSEFISSLLGKRLKDTFELITTFIMLDDVNLVRYVALELYTELKD